MPTRRTLLFAWPALLTATALGGMTEVVSAEEPARLVVVVAKSSPLAELSFAQLRRMYLGEPVDSGGQRLVPFNRGRSVKERIVFDRLVLGMSQDEVVRYWVDRRIRGQSGAPKAVDPVDVHQRVVVKVAGGIGYVRTGELRDDVKAVRIDGKAPTDPGYPLLF